ncbi:hypothetical protein DES53_117102 [Roseimicrobium gellanilyticum]|uniref:Uncharacterized protein n=1 Tax=Roseimicrobium gellanilyticum TaxID=748857 RepID=A0A366H4X5_9BACT|nr:hypothetical protein [Roseimicrobium gellanilyticum]RBP36391.1 hypothetical protein DES53_117102 [Roseimicrobium gellanilyticum]
MNLRALLHKRRRLSRHGSVLVEASIALGAATVLSLLMMKASMLAIGGNDWTTMQTLTDSIMTRETALANRVPFAQISATNSPWPEVVPAPVTIQLGRTMGGQAVNGSLIRFRENQADTSQPEVNLTMWRLHSVIKYQVGDRQYVKSSSTLRSQ